MNVKLTCYWLIDLLDYAGGEPTEEIEAEGKKFILPSNFVHDLRLEGCGNIPCGVICYDGEKYYVLDRELFPWGQDAMDMPLIPYRSIAVDPHVFKLGNEYSLSVLENRCMPGGLMHDGRVKACDTGGAIGGGHIDLFVGTKKNWKEMLRDGFPTTTDMFQI